jgi:PII-like signaling protein
MLRDVTVVRIYLVEGDHRDHHLLLEEILSILHDRRRVRGMSVFRAISGFGARGVVHSADLLRLTAHLPLVVEFFDEPAVVESALELIGELMPPGHIVSWPAHCDCGSGVQSPPPPAPGDD